jgi:sorting nexin-29
MKRISTQNITILSEVSYIDLHVIFQLFSSLSPLKCGGDEVVRLIHKLIMDIWGKEYVLKEWRKSIICPIYKKGDKLECMNYRRIALLCTAYKVFANILRNRLEPITERIIGEFQAGFRPGRSTIDQFFTVKQTLEKCWEYSLSVYQIYVDYKQAYDSIQREKLYTIMYEFGLPPKLVRLVRATMTGREAQVKVQTELTNTFEIRQPETR